MRENRKAAVDRKGAGPRVRTLVAVETLTVGRELNDHKEALEGWEAEMTVGMLSSMTDRRRWRYQ